VLRQKAQDVVSLMESNQAFAAIRCGIYGFTSGSQTEVSRSTGLGIFAKPPEPKLFDRRLRIDL
jgi:hypothetical protein